VTEPPAPVGIYEPFTCSGDLVFVSAISSARDGDMITGKVGRDLSLDDGREAARRAADNLLAVLETAGKVEAVLLLRGQVNAADLAFEVRPDEDIAGATITFTDKLAELSGMLQDAAGHPTPEFSIILFPVDKALWTQRSRRLRPPVRASTDGRFKLTNLLPGDYYLAALSDFDPSDYTKPSFLEQVALAAMKVTIAEGEKKVQNVKIAGGSLTGDRTPGQER